MSTKIMSGPICLMSLYGMTIFGSQRRNPSHWFPSGHHDLTDASAALIELQITDMPQLFTVSDIDHIFAF